MKKYFELAKRIAMKELNHKHYWFGAVGIRSDGKIVISKNIVNCGRDINCHAETRLSRKLDVGSVVYVVRVSKVNGDLLYARPCIGCQNKMKAAGVKEVFYSINNNEWGQLYWF